MYVCMCNGYRDADLREVARTGILCAEEAYVALGRGPNCGNCLDCAQWIIDQVHMEEFTSPAPPHRDHGAADQRGA